MKVSIPLNSTLSTDSHSNDIKDPGRDRDLFNKNRSYLYNGHLTNARKKIVPPGDYITTRGDLLSVIPGSEKTQIYHNGRVIADVLSLGIEDISFLDKDDAVIHEGSLWTVIRTLTGYTLERTDLVTLEVTTTEVAPPAGAIYSFVDVRLIRNTHKVITRNSDGSVNIDGVNYNSTTYPEMAEYLNNFTGEFTAAEINGNIYFGYNNPAGVILEKPTEPLTFNIAANVNGWSLREQMDLASANQDLGYQININIANGVIVGAGENGFALDLLTNIANPLNQKINLNIGSNAYITGKGGDAGYGRLYYHQLMPGQNGTTAINVGTNITITGIGTIQGGGGGGSGIDRSYNYLFTGGGGAGQPPGLAESLFNQSGQPGTLTKGGAAPEIPEHVPEGDSPGKGGDPGQAGEGTTEGQGGNAIRLVRPATLSIHGPTILGGVVEV